MRVVAISGGLSTPSSSRALATELLDAVRDELAHRGEEAETELVELREHAHAITDALLTHFPSPALAEIIEALSGADAIIVVSPTFQAGMSGLVKSFFDVIEAGALKGLPVLMAATGGTERHSLVLEYAMRPMFAYMQARPIGTAIYAATQDFGGEGTQQLRQRVRRGAAELADAMLGSPRARAEEDFVEFGQLLGRG